MEPAVLLMTGFEPFGGDGFNPSGQLAKALHGTGPLPGVRIHGVVLPVSGPAAWRKMSAAIRRIRPRWIAATGVSGRAELSIETTAWNELDYRIHDNSGHQPQGGRILARGPGRLVSPLAERLAAHAYGGGALPVRSSQDPGRFVCNFLYYRLLHLTRRPDDTAGGRSVFLHLPATLEMRRSGADRRFFHPLEDLQTRLQEVLAEICRS